MAALRVRTAACRLRGRPRLPAPGARAAGCVQGSAGRLEERRARRCCCARRMVARFWRPDARWPGQAIARRQPESARGRGQLAARDGAWPPGARGLVSERGRAGRRHPGPEQRQRPDRQHGAGRGIGRLGGRFVGWSAPQCRIARGRGPGQRCRPRQHPAQSGSRARGRLRRLARGRCAKRALRSQCGVLRSLAAHDAQPAGRWRGDARRCRPGRNPMAVGARPGRRCGDQPCATRACDRRADRPCAGRVFLGRRAHERAGSIGARRAGRARRTAVRAVGTSPRRGCGRAPRCGGQCQHRRGTCRLVSDADLVGHRRLQRRQCVEFVRCRASFLDPRARARADGVRCRRAPCPGRPGRGRVRRRGRHLSPDRARRFAGCRGCAGRLARARRRGSVAGPDRACGRGFLAARAQPVPRRHHRLFERGQRADD